MTQSVTTHLRGHVGDSAKNGAGPGQGITRLHGLVKAHPTVVSGVARQDALRAAGHCDQIPDPVRILSHLPQGAKHLFVRLCHLLSPAGFPMTDSEGGAEAIAGLRPARNRPRTLRHVRPR